jgi:hypothetical protein
MGLHMGTFWEKIQFWKNWKKMKTPLEGVDFDFHKIEDSDLTGIKLLNGKYRDITYYYGVVKIQEQGELATVNFEFRVLESTIYTEEQLQKDAEFVTLLGEILTEIIINQSVKHDTTRNNDTEESNIL